MNKNDIRLQRLFAAARSAEEEPAEEMPEDMKRRILADWRVGAHIEDAWATLVLVFRRGLVCASVVMISALAWTYAASNDVPLNDEALANIDLRAQMMP